MAKEPDLIYQVKVSLNHIRPPIWRRIQVQGNTTLHKLHDILQAVMGWEDEHLHMFTIEGTRFGDSSQDDRGMLGTQNEARHKLSQVIDSEGQRFSYEYDFGDNWEHSLLVEKILQPQEGSHYPVCLKGKRACPPEDVGGPWGYEGFLEAIFDRKNKAHKEALEWIGGEFDPEAFDIEEVNRRLRNIGRGKAGQTLDAGSITGNEPLEVEIHLDSSWPAALPEDQQTIAEGLPLRRDIVALLTYLRDNKVTGTQSTGNFPLKAVKEICERFVNPPKLEETIGGQVIRFRSEYDVWPLFFRHLLAVDCGLIIGGLGQRWKLTTLGENFLNSPAPLQIWTLIENWWVETNWANASPIVYEDDAAPARIPGLVLKYLLDLLPGKPAAFENFADKMIKDAGMVWPIEDQDNARFILHSNIKYMAIDPLLDFGILQAEYVPHETLGAEYPQLSTFLITPFGKGLLDSINDAKKSQHL